MFLSRPRKSQMPTREIETATIKDLRFIQHLGRRFFDQIGFLPTQAIVEYVESHRVVMARENNQPAGFVMTRPQLRSAKWCRPLTQVAVELDARRMSIGTQLLEYVQAEAFMDFKLGLQCWCAEDLEAVDFFRAQGYQHVYTREPLNRRKRKLLLMRKSLQPFMPADFYRPPRVAGCVPRLVQRTF